MGISTADYLAMDARLKKACGKLECPVPRSEGVAKEELLHAEIRDECLRRGWYPIHSPMHRRTSFDMPKGTTVLDFCIAMDRSRMLWVECKKKGEKPTEVQRNTIAWLRKLGHTVGVCWSFQDFLNLIDNRCESKESEAER